jgi:hypothetical protein
VLTPFLRSKENCRRKSICIINEAYKKINEMLEEGVLKANGKIKKTGMGYH